MAPVYIGAANATNKFLGNLSSDPSSGNAEGDQYFNTTDDEVKMYDGTKWVALSKDLIGDNANNPGASAAALIAAGRTGNGYYWIKFPTESSATRRWCDLSNGYMLLAHWSPNTTSGNGDTAATVGSTSYANAKGYTGVTAAAVAAPGSSEDASTNTWVWDSDTRGTETGGSFFRNSNTNGTNNANQTRQYMPKHHGFQWRYMKWGVRYSVPGGTADGGQGSPTVGNNYNSMDNFSPNSSSIDDCYVDGLSITHGNAGGRGHIFTIHVNGTPTSGNNGGSAPSFTNQGNGRFNMSSVFGATSASFTDFNDTYDKGSSSSNQIEWRICSDQDSANEDSYVRAWYILIK